MLKNKPEEIGFDPAEYTNLVHCFIKRFIGKNPTFRHLKEDLTSSCFEYMVKASRVYDPEKGTITTLCWRYFNTAIKKCLAHTNSAVSSPEAKDYIPCRTMTGSIRREAERHIEYEINPTAVVDITKMLKSLPERTAKILVLKYGLFGNKTHSDSEIGRMMGVTKQRVHQVRKEAISQLREIYVNPQH